MTTASSNNNIIQGDTITASSYVAKYRAYALKFNELDFVSACNEEFNVNLLKNTSATPSGISSDIALLPTWMFLGDEQLNLNLFNGVTLNTGLKKAAACASNDCFLTYCLAFSTGGNLSKKLHCLKDEHPQRTLSLKRHMKELLEAGDRYIQTTQENLEILKKQFEDFDGKAEEEAAKNNNNTGEEPSEDDTVLVLIATSSFVADHEFYQLFGDLQMRVASDGDGDGEEGEENEEKEEETIITQVATDESGKVHLEGTIMPFSDAAVLERSNNKNKKIPITPQKPGTKWVSVKDSMGSDMLEKIVIELKAIQRATLGICERENSQTNPLQMWSFDEEFTRIAIKVGFDKLRSAEPMLNTQAYNEILKFTMEEENEEEEEEEEQENPQAASKKKKQKETTTNMTREEAEESRRQAVIVLGNIMLGVQLAVSHSEDAGAFMKKEWINNNIQPQHMEETRTAMLSMLTSKASLLLAAPSTMFLSSHKMPDKKEPRIVSGYDWFDPTIEPWTATLMRLSCGSVTRAIAFLRLVQSSWRIPRDNTSTPCDICTGVTDCANRAFGAYEESTLDRAREKASAKKGTGNANKQEKKQKHRYSNAMYAFVNTRGIPHWNQTFTPLGNADDIANSYEVRKDSKPLTEEEKKEKRQLGRYIWADNGSGESECIDYSSFSDVNIVFAREIRANVQQLIKDNTPGAQRFKAEIAKIPLGPARDNKMAVFVRDLWVNTTSRMNQIMTDMETKIGTLFLRKGYVTSTFNYKSGCQGSLCHSVSNRHHLFDGPMNAFLSMVSNIGMMQIQMAHQRGTQEPAGGYTPGAMMSTFKDMEDNINGSMRFFTKRVPVAQMMRCSNGSRSIRAHRAATAKKSGQAGDGNDDYEPNPNTDEESQYTINSWPVSQHIRLKYSLSRVVKPEGQDGGDGAGEGDDAAGSTSAGAGTSSTNNTRLYTPAATPSGLVNIANSFAQAIMFNILAAIFGDMDMQDLILAVLHKIISLITRLDDATQQQNKPMGKKMREKLAAFKEFMIDRFDNIPYVVARPKDIKITNDRFLPLCYTMMASECILSVLSIKLKEPLVCPVLIQKQRVHPDITFLAQTTASLCVPVTCNSYEKFHKLIMKTTTTESMELKVFGPHGKSPSQASSCSSMSKYKLRGAPNFTTHLFAPNYDGEMGNHQEYVNKYGRESVKQSDVDMVFNPLLDRQDVQRDFAKNKQRATDLLSDLFFADMTFDYDNVLLTQRRKLMASWLAMEKEDPELSKRCEWSYKSMGTRGSVFDKVSSNIETLADNCISSQDQKFFKDLMASLINNFNNDEVYALEVDAALQRANMSRVGDEALDALDDWGMEEDDDDAEEVPAPKLQKAVVSKPTAGTSKQHQKSPPVPTKATTASKNTAAAKASTTSTKSNEDRERMALELARLDSQQSDAESNESGGDIDGYDSDSEYVKQSLAAKAAAEESSGDEEMQAALSPASVKKKQSVPVKRKMSDPPEADQVVMSKQKKQIMAKAAKTKSVKLVVSTKPAVSTKNSLNFTSKPRKQD